MNQQEYSETDQIHFSKKNANIVIDEIFYQEQVNGNIQYRDQQDRFHSDIFASQLKYHDHVNQKRKNSKQNQFINSQISDVLRSQVNMQSEIQNRQFKQVIQQLELFSHCQYVLEQVVCDQRLMKIFKSAIQFQESTYLCYNFIQNKNFGQKTSQQIIFDIFIANTKFDDDLLIDENVVQKNIKDIQSVPTINQTTKQLLIEYRNKTAIIKDVIQKSKKIKKKNTNSDHSCKICGDYFDNGRKLGGHMSRKHPGSSRQYMLKKQIYKAKKLQRNRRKYFKQKKEDLLKEQTPIKMINQ